MSVTQQLRRARELSATHSLPAWLGARALALVALSGAFVAYALYLGRQDMVDDAAISLAYARNLVHGHGLVLTPGAPRVEGYSNFLWVLAMAPAFVLRLDPVWSARMGGLALSVAALVLLAWVPGIAMRRRGGWLDLLAPALVATSLPFAIWSVSGMENGLEAFLLVAVVALTYRELNEPDALPWSAVALFGLAITRPEGVAYGAAAVAHRALLYALGRRNARQDAMWLAAYVAPLLAYNAWHYAYFRELVPNTYYAKADRRTLSGVLGYATDRNDPGFHYLKSFFGDYWLLWIAPLVPLALWGRANLERYSLVLLMALAGLSAVLFSGGDWMHNYRFVTPLLPLIFLLVQEGARNATGLAMSTLRSNLRAVATGAAAAGVLAIAIVPSAIRIDDVRSHPYAGSYSILLSYSRTLELVSNQLSIEDPSLLTGDIGATALDTKFRIVDLGGLADRYIARHGRGVGLHNYVYGQQKPDLIWLHEPFTSGSGLKTDPRFASDYLLWNAKDSGAKEDFGLYVRKDVFQPDASCSDAVPLSDAGRFIGKLATVELLVGGVQPAPNGQDTYVFVEGSREFLVVATGAATVDAALVRVGGMACARGIVRQVGDVVVLTSEMEGSIIPLP